MRRFNRIGINLDESDQRYVASIGFDLPVGMNIFTVDSSDPRWPPLCTFLGKRGMWTEQVEFDESEIQAAKYCYFVSAHPHGYLIAPETTMRQACGVCRCGAVQDHPYRMKQEPRWGRKVDLIRFQGGSEALFCKPETWELVFRPLGVERLPVLNARGTRQLETVVQLIPKEIVPLESTRPAGTCGECGSESWNAIFRGPLPAVAAPATEHLFLTKQWFRQDAYVFRAVVGSATLVTAMREHDVKGAVLWPLSDPTDEDTDMR